MMLHIKKSESIVQWYNSLTAKGNVNSLEQFTDGSYFSRIITTLRGGSKEDNLATESVIFSETSIACNEEVITSVEEETDEGKIESSVSDADPFVVKECDLTDTQKTYDDIRMFIDDFYHIDSSSLIDYEECMKGNELELAKVAIFLLSAMVQTFLSAENELVYNTTLLEMEVQENIHECLALVVQQQESQLKKADLHKVLCRAASHKAGTPVRKSSRSTSDPNDALEGVKNASKKRKDRQSIVVFEDLQNSPLKTLLESPKIQYKTALLRKESELKKLRSALHDEENKVIEITSEKQNLNEELAKKKKELEFYKKELKSHREALYEKEEQEKKRDEELKAKKIEAEKVRKLIESQEEEIKKLKESNESLQDKLDEIDKKRKHDEITNLEIKKLNGEIQELKHELKLKDKLIDSLQRENANFVVELKKYQDSPTSGHRMRLRYADTPPKRKDQEHSVELRSGMTSDESVLGLSIQRESDEIKSPKNEDSKDDSQLRPNISDDCLQLLSNAEALNKGRLEFSRRQLKCIFSKLRCKNIISPEIENILKDECTKINCSDAHVVLLRDLLLSLNCTPEPQVATCGSEERSLPRSRSQAGEERRDAVSLNKTKNSEKKSQPTKADLIKENESLSKDLLQKIHQIGASKMEADSLRKEAEKLKMEADSLRPEAEKLRMEVNTLKQNVTSLKQELAIAKDKYINMETLVKKKEEDIKKALFMYQRIVKLNEKEKGTKKCNEECEKLRRRCKQLNEMCFEFEQETGELKRSIKHLEGMMEHLQFEIKELKKEKKELEHKLWKETAALSRKTSDRDALVLHYLKKSKHEPQKNRNIDFDREEKKFSRPVVKVDVNILNSDNEPSMSNSVLASRSIPSNCFQVADEDDFLNESSLAEIHNGGVPEGEPAENRLHELQRRNTLCPPHLQSSYPLEIQNMTPSERKYYNPGEVSFDLGSKNSQYHVKRDIHNRPKSKYMESDEDEADDSHSFPVKRRKISEAETISVPASKKYYQPSTSVVRGPSKDQGIPKKPSTPLKRMAAFVKRQSTNFRTPSSVNRLIKLQRKNKIH